MTKNEMRDLEDLGMTPDELEQRRREVEAKLHAEPNGSDVGGSILHRDGHSTEFGPSRQRKTRADKGVPRAPKPLEEAPLPPGAITKQQAAQLVRLAEIMCASHQKLDEARRENHQALHDYCKYVESLTTN